MTNTRWSWILNSYRLLSSTIGSLHHSSSRSQRNSCESLCHFTISVLSCFLRFYQLLENKMLLLVLADCDIFSVYLECLPVLDMSIPRGRRIRTFSREKLGNGDLLFAFNESKRALAVYASTKVLRRWSFHSISNLTRQSRFSSTCSSSMSLSRLSQGMEAPLI